MSLSFSLKKNKNGVDYYKSIEDSISKNTYLLSEESKSFKDLIFSVISVIHSEKLFAKEELQAYLTLLFTKILSRMTGAQSEQQNQLATPEYYTRTYIIEDYFNEHYKENITLSELSKRLHLGEQQTDRMIKRIYKVGFRQRLTKIRIKTAIELLSETKKSLLEISQAVGYESYSGFYTAFKKITGISPEKWKSLQK